MGCLDVLPIDAFRDIRLRCSGHRKMPVEKHLFGLFDSLLQNLRRDRTVINIKKRDVIESHFVKQNDELHEVGVGFLPEGSFPLPKRLVRSDAIL